MKASASVVTAAAVEERWHYSWALAGAQAPATQLPQLLERYAEPHRAYHNLDHILACLELAASVRSELDSPATVELALWYHDAIYEPRATDNEERSAELAVAALALAPEAMRLAVAQLILATRHLAIPADQDARYLVDIDLAILGAPPEAFDDYEVAIRREYRWVPGPLFRRKRREILASFLDRPSIYSTRHFRDLLEAPARANLARSIEKLS